MVGTETEQNVEVGDFPTWSDYLDKYVENNDDIPEDVCEKMKNKDNPVFMQRLLNIILYYKKHFI